MNWRRWEIVIAIHWITIGKSSYQKRYAGLYVFQTGTHFCIMKFYLCVYVFSMSDCHFYTLSLKCQIEWNNNQMNWTVSALTKTHGTTRYTTIHPYMHTYMHSIKYRVSWHIDDIERWTVFFLRCISFVFFIVEQYRIGII